MCKFKIVAICAAIALLLAPVAALPEKLPTVSLATQIQGAHFAEPLLATAPTTPEEDDALARALIAFTGRSQAEDTGSLTAFLSDHPHSGWAPALYTNLGLTYLHYGYFSRALDAWQRAWEGGKNASGPRPKALIDRAVGELARLEASLGQNDSLTTLFAEIGRRPITGSATEAVQAAREELTLAAKDQGHLFICGPLALQSLMLAQGAKPKDVDFLQWIRAGANGTTLAEVSHLAEKAKLSYRLLFRKPGQPVPMPAIVHWSVGHFAAVVAKANGRYRIADPCFPAGTSGSPTRRSTPRRVAISWCRAASRTALVGAAFR